MELLPTRPTLECSPCSRLDATKDEGVLQTSTHVAYMDGFAWRKPAHTSPAGVIIRLFRTRGPGPNEGRNAPAYKGQ
jgi:hypothetical protein